MREIKGKSKPKAICEIESAHACRLHVLAGYGKWLFYDMRILAGVVGQEVLVLYLWDGLNRPGQVR